MKRIITLLVCLFMAFQWAEAQKIKKNEVDKFTGTRVIETSFKNICSKILPLERLYVAFKMVDNMPFMMLRVDYFDCFGVEAGEDKVILVDSKGKTYKYMTLRGGVAEPLSSRSDNWTLTLSLLGDLTFAGKQITGIRIYTTQGYIDYEISEYQNESFQKTYQVFISAIPE